MASSDATLTNSQSVSPVITVRQPTARKARTDSEVPIRNSTRIMPRRAISESCGDQVEMTGTVLRNSEASRKNPMNHGTAILNF